MKKDIKKLEELYLKFGISKLLDNNSEKEFYSNDTITIKNPCENISNIEFCIFEDDDDENNDLEIYILFTNNTSFSIKKIKNKYPEKYKILEKYMYTVFYNLFKDNLPEQIKREEKLK